MAHKGHEKRTTCNLYHCCSMRGKCFRGLTRLCSGLGSGRENLPLHIFCL